MTHEQLVAKEREAYRQMDSVQRAFRTSALANTAAAALNLWFMFFFNPEFWLLHGTFAAFSLVLVLRSLHRLLVVRMHRKQLRTLMAQHRAAFPDTPPLNPDHIEA